MGIGLYEKMRVVDFNSTTKTFLEDGVDHGGRIKLVYRWEGYGWGTQARYEIWHFPGHAYTFGIDAIGYAPSTYAIVRVWKQEFHFMGDRKPCLRLAGDRIVSIQPGKKWRAAIKLLKSLIGGLATLDRWPLTEEDRAKIAAQLTHLKRGNNDE